MVLSLPTSLYVAAGVLIGIIGVVTIRFWLTSSSQSAEAPSAERTQTSSAPPKQLARVPFLGPDIDNARAIDPYILLPLPMTEEDPQQLLSFACALKHRYGDEPVHLVSVVNDDAGKTADSRSDADAYLKRIAEQEPGNTAMRMAVYEGSDVSAGVVQSARETDTDLLVMGWDAVCAADRSTFGRTVDAVLAQLPLPVYLCRIGQGLSEITHIHFVIPWEIDHHQGFYEAIYNAKQLAAELDVGITVYTYGEHAHRYRQLFDLVEIDIKAEFKLTSSWSDLQSEFALHLQSTDFVITLAVREGEIGWDDELWTFPTHYADVAAQSYALFFLREDDRKHDDQFLRTN